MKKNKYWIFSSLIYIFLIGAIIFPGVRAQAYNGQPPCCLYLSGTYPDTVMMAFKGARPVDFKILGIVKKITSKKPYQIDLNVLSIIDKKKIIDLRMRAAIMKFDIPKRLIWLTKQIREGDHIMLIPAQAYNTQLDKKMYDFIKIPIEMIK